MNKAKYAAWIGILTTLTACALNPLMADKGRHIDHVIAVNGRPNKVSETQTGRVYYWQKLPSRAPEYHRQHSHTEPNRQGGQTRYYETICRQRYAERYYYTDANGIVTDIKMNGWYERC